MRRSVLVKVCLVASGFCAVVATMWAPELSWGPRELRVGAILWLLSGVFAGIGLNEQVR